VGVSGLGARLACAASAPSESALGAAPFCAPFAPAFAASEAGAGGSAEPAGGIVVVPGGAE
jgi:hypothetical protein